MAASAFVQFEFFDLSRTIVRTGMAFCCPAKSEETAMSASSSGAAAGGDHRHRIARWENRLSFLDLASLAAAFEPPKSRARKIRFRMAVQAGWVVQSSARK
jgi:hypothetical protein